MGSGRSGDRASIPQRVFGDVTLFMVAAAAMVAATGALQGGQQAAPGIEVVTMDERLTSAQAHRALSEMGASMRERREAVDGMAAQIILQRHLERRRADRQVRE